MITLHDYAMGRDSRHRGEWTREVQENAAITVQRVNALLAAMAVDGLAPESHPSTGTVLSSGWRPAAVNAATPGAAAKSRHMTGQAADLYDPDGALDDWCLENQPALDALGLWLEHPAATKGWCHVQTVPPKSGRRVFYP